MIIASMRSTIKKQEFETSDKKSCDGEYVVKMSRNKPSHSAPQTRARAGHVSSPNRRQGPTLN